MSNNQTKKIIIPKNNEVLSEFFGILYGDGHFSKNKNYQIRLNSIDKEFTNRFYFLFENLFGIKGRIYVDRRRTSAGRKIYTCTFISKEVCNYLLKNINYNIPKWILKKDKNFFAFCRGFFDSEGCVQNRYINCVQVKHSKIIKQIYDKLKFYLNNDGISLKKYNKSYNKKPYKLYVLYINGLKSFIFYRENIGFTIDRKKNKLDKIIKRIIKSNRYKNKDLKGFF